MDPTGESVDARVAHHRPAGSPDRRRCRPADDRGRRCRLTAIRALVADRVRIPLRRPIATASGMWLEHESWVIRVHHDDGRTGLGEAVAEPSAGEVADT